jgi:hypothetical protein
MFDLSTLPQAGAMTVGNIRTIYRSQVAAGRVILWSELGLGLQSRRTISELSCAPDSERILR